MKNVKNRWLCGTLKRIAFDSFFYAKLSIANKICITLDDWSSNDKPGMLFPVGYLRFQRAQ